MKRRLRIPRGWYIVRNRTRIHEGDRFKAADGRWIRTYCVGARVTHGYVPMYKEQPGYEGIYIRKRRTAK